MDETPNTLTSGFGLALNKVQEWTAEFYTLLPNILAGFVILLLFTIIAFSLKRGVGGYFKMRDRIDLGQILSDFAFWMFIVLGCLVALTIITPSIRPVDLISGLGLGSLAVGFAFKDILQNWLSGLLILLKLPFRRGDQIKVNDVEGTVVRIEPRATIIRTYDGKDIVVPNTTIYTNDVSIQTSQDVRRVEMDITVGYEYGVSFIREILLGALTQIDEIKKEPAPQVLCWELGATSLGLKLRWWISSERSQEIISRARAVEAIKLAFEANDIDPTDPSLVYTREAYSPDDPEGPTEIEKRKENKKKQSLTKPVAGKTPPAYEMGYDDPETYTPKKDNKDKTLLSEPDATS